MADMELVIKIPEKEYNIIKNSSTFMTWAENLIKNGIPLPKGHGKLVDISKIDEDKIESDNPIIGLTINGQYTEAISLDYLNNLPTIIEADKGESEKKMTYDELIKSFKNAFPSAEIEDYRPVCHEFFEKGKVGITIWLKNGDMVVYYPKQNEEGNE